jgi:hypothetical protein
MNFLTYANTDLGFTIKYPSDWKSTVTKGSGGSNYVVLQLKILSECPKR